MRKKKSQPSMMPTEAAIETPDVGDQTMSNKQPKRKRTKQLRGDTRSCDSTGHKEECTSGQQNMQHSNEAEHTTCKKRKRKLSSKSNLSVAKQSVDCSGDEGNPNAVPLQTVIKLQGKQRCAEPSNSSKVESSFAKHCFKSEVVHRAIPEMPQTNSDRVHDRVIEDAHKVPKKRRKTGVLSPQCQTATSTRNSKTPSLQTLDNFLVDTSQKPSSPPDKDIPKLDTPAPKRSRLSLKGMKCKPMPDQTTENNTRSLPSSARSHMTNGSDHMTNGSCHMTGPSAVNRAVSKRPSSRKVDSPPVPCVTAFHNLGNTCYLNSVLQVLRYTPGFVQQLQSLALELKLSQKQMEEADSSEDEDEEEGERHLVWKLVHDLNKMFKKMSSTERKFQSGDTEYIALRPYEILDVLEKLNPMFEGNDQHDCHELLRCLLSYVEDAAKQLNKLRQENRAKYAPLLNALRALKPVIYKGDDIDPESDGTEDRSEGCVRSGCLAVSDNEDDCFTVLDKAPTSSAAVQDACVKREENRTDKDTILFKERKQSSEEPPVKMSSLISKELSESECKPNKENCTLEEDGGSVGCPTTKLKNRVIGNPIQNSILGYMVATETGAQTNRDGRLSRHKKTCRTKHTVRHPQLESEEKEKSVSVPGAMTVTVHHPDTNSEHNLKPLHRRTARKSVPYRKNISPATTTSLKEKAKAGGEDAVVVLESLGKCPKSVNVTSIGRSVQPVPNLVKDTFEGVMALRTKCLVCEGYTERREEYQDVSLPAKQIPRNDSDSEDGDSEESLEPGIGWMLDAVREREMLIGNNKYRCECCNSLVEAERSQHYPNIPPVLTIQLKRFAAFSRSSQEFTKINDHVPTARVLPCIKADCQSECAQNNHRYELYAAITHTGISLSSGHYVAYVKTPEPNNKHFPHQTPATNQTPASQSCDAKSANQGQGPDPNNNEAVGQSLAPREKKSTVAKKHKQPGKDKVSWYECDDELIMPLSEKAFNKMLDPSGTATPYLLFYRTLSE